MERIAAALSCVVAIVVFSVDAAHAAAQKSSASTTSAVAQAAAAAALTDSNCLHCHSTSAKPIEVTGEDDEKRTLRAYPQEAMSKGVHGKLACVSCHTDIKDSQAKHQRESVKKVDCAQCHIDLLATAKADNRSAEQIARLEAVVKNVEAYHRSFHARPDKDHPKQPKAACDNCHDTHTFNVPAKDSPAYKAWRQTIPHTCGDKCHDEQIETWSESAHGKSAQEKTDGKAAVCTDCHTTHEITNTSLDSFKLLNTRECGNCHKQQNNSYRDTYHGQVNRLGYTHTAKCYNCHGSHGILAAKDPESKVHPDNRLKTCRQCHDGKKQPMATAGFVSFGPHAYAGDREKYPQVWFVSRFMLSLLVGVFAYFWLHCILWWFREYKHHKDQESEIRIHAEELKHEFSEMHVRRFGTIWRIGHLCFAISVMTLILTGMAVFYPATTWAPLVAKAFGGPQFMGIVHRTAAAIMLSIFFLHLIGVSVNIARNWKTFRFFGPDSLVPRWQDFKDAWGMFKWFAGKGPRPIFDRWTYWEKFDYWAVFWGMGIIGSSGMMLAFPHITATYLPGWIFNVATLVHGEEAFLAAVFLFTVHFFNNHFRPAKLPPPDVVMFTGTQSLDEFRREHGAQYQRLVDSGELEKYLVKAPSRPLTVGSRVLGLFLIAVGLTLLFLVANGFFKVLGS